MLYVQRKPGPALAPFVRLLWVARDSEARHTPRRERVLPSGSMQVILNLAGDRLTDLSGPEPQPAAAALLAGVQRRFQTIATQDFEHLAGVVLRPGGFQPVFGMDADEFSDREVGLSNVLGAGAEELRGRLQETQSLAGQMDRLEEALLARVARRNVWARCGLTDFALRELRAGRSIAQIVRSSGLSANSLAARFRRQVGVTPKTFDRIQRFQRAVQTMHRGRTVRWDELALHCGFYDQAHLSHEFRAFAGICPTQYKRSVRQWSNHVPVD
jgi:AraC-like DNA-binding protein